MEMEDEFDSRRGDGRAKVVGRGLGARKRNPVDPQWYLAGSDHPYAPFPGNALKWESFVYDDGTTYEGLAREWIPHGKGVMVFGQGTGGGIQIVEPGDKYEGEFNGGFAHGLGAFTSKTGEVYRGEWFYGKRNGCGAATNFQPFFRELAKGTSPEDAWKRTKNLILNKRMFYGQWKGNAFLRSSADSGTCNVREIRGMLQEMESVLTKTRMFQHKPDGDVTHVTKRDKLGTPVTTFQDPLHYPHGTMFLAPGPIGQCHPIPDDDKLKSEMKLHARNFLRIYNQYNLPYLAQPGDDLFAAARLDLIRKARRELRARLRAGEDKEDILSDLANKLQAPSEEYLAYEAEQKKPDKKAAKPKQRRRPPPRPKQYTPQQQAPADDDLDDEDLVAQPPSKFASLSLTSQQLRRTLHSVARHAAENILPRIERRRSLMRS